MQLMRAGHHFRQHLAGQGPEAPLRGQQVLLCQIAHERHSGLQHHENELHLLAQAKLLRPGSCQTAAEGCLQHSPVCFTAHLRSIAGGVRDAAGRLHTRLSIQRQERGTRCSCFLLVRTSLHTAHQHNTQQQLEAALPRSSTHVKVRRPEALCRLEDSVACQLSRLNRQQDT